MTTCVESEAWILLNEPLEAAPEQRRADEQHDGEADFGDHERAARAAPRAALLAAAPGFFQRALHVAARHQDGRHDAERQRRETGDRDRKPEHARIDARRADVFQPGHGHRRSGDQRLDEHDREHDAERRPDHGQDDALGEELHHEPATARPDRRADGHLALARRRPRQQQARDIRARDEQQEPGGAEQREQRRPEVAFDLVRERNRARPPVAVGRLELGAQPRRQGPQLRVGLLDADRGFQPEQRLDEMRAAAVLREIPLQALPHVRVVGIVEPRRHHAAHRVNDGAERDRLADDGGIAVEPLAPETMADDRQAIARIEGRRPGTPRR